MDKTLKFARLDALMIKPYFKKNLILMIVLPIFVSVVVGNPIMVNVALVMLSLVLAAYPFALMIKMILTSSMELLL